MPDDQWEIAATEADQTLNLTEFGRTFRKENVAYWQMWEEMDKLESKDLSKFKISLRTASLIFTRNKQTLESPLLLY